MHHPEASLGKQALLQSRQVIPRFTTTTTATTFGDAPRSVLFVVLMPGIFMACSKFDLLAKLSS